METSTPSPGEFIDPLTAALLARNCRMACLLVATKTADQKLGGRAAFAMLSREIRDGACSTELPGDLYTKIAQAGEIAEAKAMSPDDLFQIFTKMANAEP